MRHWVVVKSDTNMTPTGQSGAESSRHRRINRADRNEPLGCRRSGQERASNRVQRADIRRPIEPTPGRCTEGMPTVQGTVFGAGTNRSTGGLRSGDAKNRAVVPLSPFDWNTIGSRHEWNVVSKQRPERRRGHARWTRTLTTTEPCDDQVKHVSRPTSGEISRSSMPLQSGN